MVLCIIDGTRENEAFTGSAVLQHLPTESRHLDRGGQGHSAFLTTGKSGNRVEIGQVVDDR